MSRRLDLSGSWAKLDRAKSHVDRLNAEICKDGTTSDPNSIPVPLWTEYDAKEGAVIFRIERVIQIREDWPLIVGDAVHNFRVALDYLMWQLAILALGKIPSESEAPRIQFPNPRRLKDSRIGGRYLIHIRQTDLDRLQPFQAYKRRKKGELHPLPKLIRLSNIDKHRRPHLLVARATAFFATNQPRYLFCEPVLTLQPDGRMTATWIHTPPRLYPRSNDEILRILVRPLPGGNPDVKIDTGLTSQITMGKLGPIVPMLDAFGKYVAAVLTAFNPRT